MKNINRIFTIICIAVLSCFSLFGQEELEPEVAIDLWERQIYSPKLAVYFDLFQLIDYTPTIFGGVELKTFKKQTISFGAGYVNNFYSENSRRSYNGYKLKGEYRFFNKENFFLGPQFLHKYLKTEGNTTIIRADNAFQEIIPITVHNRLNIIHVTGGRTFFLSKSFFLELSLGYGVKFINATFEGLPEGVLPEDVLIDEVGPNRFNFDDNGGKSTAFSFFLGFRLLYDFGSL